MAKGDIPDIVIGRLPIYLRALTRLQTEGREITSSHELGTQLGISSAQIRKDLSHFGEFGKQGTGYTIATLMTELEKILNVDKEWKVAVVGIGHLGQAVANYGGFEDRGYKITHLFDSDEHKIGTEVAGITVKPVSEIEEIVRKEGLRVAMVATPAGVAQNVADKLIAGGVRGILCYAPIIISVPDDVHVQYIDPVIHLQRMSFYIAE